MKEFEGCHVLLADDDEVTREVVANIVEDLGAACETALNGTELIRKLNGPKGEWFDLVLTDINMPQKGGIEACAEFRASSHPKAKLYRMSRPFAYRHGEALSLFPAF